MTFLRLIARLSLGSVLAVTMVACAHEDAPTPAVDTTTPTRDDHLAVGNPSGAVADVNQPMNFLVTKPQYVLSYHRDRGIPNWVSWQLSSV